MLMRCRNDDSESRISEQEKLGVSGLGSGTPPYNPLATRVKSVSVFLQTHDGLNQ